MTEIYRQITSQKPDITRRTPEAACWLWLGHWSNNAASSHSCPGPFNSGVLRPCPVLQCSYPPYWSCHQRIVTGCLRPKQADNIPILAGIQPVELRRNAAKRLLPRRVKEPRHLSHSALTCPPGANARRHKSRHPFVTAAQPISLSDNNMRAAHLADHQWNGEWLDNLMRLRTFIPDTGTHPEWPSQKQRGSGLTASAPMLDVSVPACADGVWPPLRHTINQLSFCQFLECQAPQHKPKSPRSKAKPPYWKLSGDGSDWKQG